jgi:flagellar biosynthesis/type III secretory pathway M-ring protein FliF/YscJ
VLAAVGFNEQRGDVVKIENVPFFSDKKPDAPTEPMAWYKKVQSTLDHSSEFTSVPVIKYIAFIVMFILTYFLFFRPIQNRVFQALPQPAYALAEGSETSLQESAMPSLPAGKPEELSEGEASAAAGLPPGEIPNEDIISLEAVSDEQIERELIREANTVDMGGRKYAAMKKKLTDKARKDPEMISQLVRTLLREKP